MAIIRLVMDEVFGRDNFVNEIVWKRTPEHSDSTVCEVHDTISLYAKHDTSVITMQDDPNTVSHMEYQMQDADTR